MKMSFRRILEIILVVVMIAAVFMPFVHDVTPYNYAYNGWISFDGIIAVSIPLSLLIPFLLLLIFQDKLKDSFLKTLQIISIFLLVPVFGDYVYMFIKGMTGIHFNVNYEFLIALFLSLTLFVLSYIFNKERKTRLLNTIMASITLPFILHIELPFYDLWDMNYEIFINSYGGFIIEISFVLVYILGLSKVFIKPKQIERN